MKKSHAGFWVGIASLFIAAVYSAILFLVKTTFDVSVWMLYGFTMVAFLLITIQSVAASRKSSSIVMDTALGVVTLIYFGLQFIFGGIICMCFSDLPMTAVLVCEIILLAAYLVIAFIMYDAQSHSAAQDQNDQNAVRKMRLLESDILGMAEEQTDTDKKKALKALAEEIHFSDVATYPALVDVEGRIAQNVAILQDELTDEAADVYARIEAIRRLLKERNRTAAILKR